MGYYDYTGYPGMIANVDTDPALFQSDDPPENYALTQPYESVSSEEHYNDYSLPHDSSGIILPDKSELGGAHPNNCVADFTKTSFSSISCRYGTTTPNNAFSGTVDYMKFQYPELAITYGYGYLSSDNFYTAFEYAKNQILQNHPVILAVDCYGQGVLDHLVLMVGFNYNKTTQTREYIAYNTWDNQLHVYSYFPALYAGLQQFTSVPFSVGVNFLFYPEPNIHREAVYYFYRNDIGSYFFTANEQEKNNLLPIQQFDLLGINHYVYNNPVIDGVVPVYRFLNNRGSHFYTASEQERDSIIQNLSHVYQLEGIAFYVLAGQIGGSKPVYRFFQPATSSHYFTISEADKADRIANDPTMNYEGVAWFAFSN